MTVLGHAYFAEYRVDISQLAELVTCSWLIKAVSADKHFDKMNQVLWRATKTIMKLCVFFLYFLGLNTDHLEEQQECQIFAQIFGIFAQTNINCLSCIIESRS